jgi:hypothetical protein
MKQQALIVSAIVILAFACGGNDTPTNERTSTDTTTSALHGQEEHKVSELAQMMRDMAAFADSTKAHLDRKEELLPYPEPFKNMILAESTPGMVDHATFDPFALAWLRQLDSLYAAPAARRDEAYNGLIQHCAVCHGTVCPGPLVRIKKMYKPIEP